MLFFNDRIFILDGATGTELQKRGMERGVCPEKWVLAHPEAIQDIQGRYARAGSNAVYAPTFGANRAALKAHGFAADIRTLCRDLVDISRSAVPAGVLVAGDISPTGLQLMPYGMATFDELVDIYAEQAAALDEAGVDFFGIETQMSLPEARAALIAVKKVSSKPVAVTFACGDTGRSVMGTDLTAALLALQDLGADAYGINCGGNLELIARLLKTMYPYSRVPLIAKPNAGLPDMSTGTAVYTMTGEDFARAAGSFAEAGAAAMGGCCGTCESHIAALAAATSGIAPIPVNPTKTFVAASQTRVADLDADTEYAELAIDDDLLDNMLSAMGEGAEVVKLHIRDEDDIDTIDDCQYGLSLPLCVSFADPALRESFQRIYHGKACIQED